jgi:hypothetical protein
MVSKEEGMSADEKLMVPKRLNGTQGRQISMLLHVHTFKYFPRSELWNIDPTFGQ